MTSPLATYPTVYAGTDVQHADLGIFLEIIRGLLESPTVRGRDVTVPGLAGRIEANRENDTLMILLEGVVGPDAADVTLEAQLASYEVNRQAVRTLFATKRARADLVVSLPGSTATISARPMNLIWKEIVQGVFAEVSIELEGYDDWVIT